MLNLLQMQNNMADNSVQLRQTKEDLQLFQNRGKPKSEPQTYQDAKRELCINKLPQTDQKWALDSENVFLCMQCRCRKGIQASDHDPEIKYLIFPITFYYKLKCIGMQKYSIGWDFFKVR